MPEVGSEIPEKEAAMLEQTPCLRTSLEGTVALDQLATMPGTGEILRPVLEEGNSDEDPVPSLGQGLRRAASS